MATITGTSGNDTLSGTAVADYINGLGGNDVLNGGEGNDTLDGGGGADRLNGDAGDDWLNGGDGNDTLMGGDGSDTLVAGAGRDFQDGGLGNDFYIVNQGDYHDTISDSGGVDTIVTTASWDLRDDFENLIGRGSGATYRGNGWNNILTSELASGQSARFYGMDGNDTLTGAAGNETLSGDGGNDHLSGGSGNDFLMGGDGADTLVGGAGNDTQHGGLGDDYYIVSTADYFDTIFDAGGVDTIVTTASWDLRGDHENLIGRAGGMAYSGNAGNNVLTSELLQGQTATFNALAGHDTLIGGAGNERLSGGDGNDHLIGSAGVDTLEGGLGDDRLSLNGGMTLDLTEIADNKVTGLEVISLDSGDNTLILDALEVLNISDSSDTLRIDGQTGDVINAGAGWTQIANITIGTQTYAQYTAGAATLQVDLDVDRSAIGIEIIGDDADNVLNGDAGHDVLRGLGGNDTLNGGDGNDMLDGGMGDDVYMVDEAGLPTFLAVNDWDWNRTDYLFTPETGTFSVDAWDSGSDADTLVDIVTAQYFEPGGHSFRVDLSTRMLDGPLEEGTYTDATAYPFESVGHPALSISGDGLGASQSYGEFTVAEAVYDYTGASPEISRLVVDFAYAPSYSGPTVTGRLSLGEDGAGDRVMELAGGGADTVISSVSYRLPENVENLVLAGSAAIDGLGNGLDNVLTGNEAVNVLFGGAGNDALDGAGGADLMAGGKGDDSYVIDNVPRISLSISNWQGADYTFTSATGIFMVGGSDWLWDGDTLPDTVKVSYSNPIGVQATMEISTRMLGTPFAAGSYFDAMRFPFETTGHPGLSLSVGGLGANTSTGSFTVVEAQFGPAFDVRELLVNFTYSGDGSPVVTGTLNVSGGRGDGIFERAGEGVDTVYAAVDYVLGANLENLVLTGSNAVSGVGNAVDNALTGNGSANSIAGYQGVDTLVGNEGNDTLDGGTGADVLDGGSGDDWFVLIDALDTLVDATGHETVISHFDHTLLGGFEDLVLVGPDNTSGTGNDDSNVLTGSDGLIQGGIWVFGGHNRLWGVLGNDTLHGGAGNDTLDGGEGEDLLFGEEGDDVLNGGLDADALDGGEGNDTLDGGTGDDALDGGEGNDTLDGGTGDDALAGGAGDDFYVVDSALDSITDSTGTDAVHTARDGYVLGGTLENLRLLGSADIGGSGNSGANWLIGNTGNNSLWGDAGNDILDGGTGNDTTIGGLGDDVHVVTQAGDVVVEANEDGTDTVSSSLPDYTLGEFIENLWLETGALNGTGNGLGNKITGNDGDNHLQGLGGNDTLVGNGGNDTLHGGTGDDTLHVFGAGLVFDLTQVENSRITDIEVIGMRGFGDTSLILALDDVLDISSSTDTLVIDGNTGDSLTVTSGTWIDGGREGDYNVYTSDTARLKVYWQISVEIPVA